MKKRKTGNNSRYYNANSTTIALPQHYHNTTIALLQYYYSTTIALLQHYHSTTIALLQHYHALLQHSYNTSTAPVQHRFGGKRVRVKGDSKKYTLPVCYTFSVEFRLFLTKKVFFVPM